MKNPPWKWFLGSAVFFGLAALDHREVAWQIASRAAPGPFGANRLEELACLLAALVLALAGVRAALTRR